MCKMRKMSLSGYFLAGFLLVLLAGFSPHTVQAATHAHKAHKVHAGHVHGKRLQAKEALSQKVVLNIRQQQGKRYRRGGVSPATGFDCSGLTQYAFRRGAGVQIPRTAADQYRIATKVSRSAARKGDLVFFHTRGKRIGHVGLYLGSGTFIHSPRPGKRVTTSALRGYWVRHLAGFGRIPGICRPVTP